MAIAPLSRRDALALEYGQRIGYNPFEDDPQATEAEVAQTLAEYDQAMIAEGHCYAWKS